MMIEDDKGIRPGIETMRGLPAFYDGAVVTTSSLTNVSLCVDLDAAKQLDRLQPMIETRHNPTLWQLQPVSNS
ncbi:hypothetical protein [Bradyrhizobium genomosp. III]|uniref:hypothetical protein n=1 Tax=Bradyrhizobium genomosp. III TaxID=2683271 RepID=UPI001F0B515A|nr:hypothetical protein [Bradyrhizobium sp. CCBAU 15635]